MATDRLKALEASFEAAVAAAVPQPGDLAIGSEEARDAGAVRALLAASFPGEAEADLVDALRRSGSIVLSLVARRDGDLVGYVAFVRIWVETGDGHLPAVALAPLAVAPAHQGRGIAGRLVKEGHACLAAMGETLSVVLGDAAFYTRFGYSRHRASGFVSDYPEEHLLAISFADAPWRGTLVYPAAFQDL